MVSRLDETRYNPLAQQFQSPRLSDGETMTLAAKLALPLVVLTYFRVAAGSYPGLKMNRATIALVGAVAIVAFQIMSPAAAMQAVDPNTLVLLFAMMVVSAHLRLAGFFDWVSQWLAQYTRS